MGNVGPLELAIFGIILLVIFGLTVGLLVLAIRLAIRAGRKR
ncbi:hypothetical protein [Microtetraspora sp. AC03309]|nr:hypothetical protein [Microtetraspora sp. AC03309]